MLYSYKMTDDTGFAPNPFFEILSLATCKPLIREKKKKGDFVAGFTSKELCDEKIGMEKLVFIMRITEKLNYSEYYNDKRFDCKKAKGVSRITQSGDNIYFKHNRMYTQAQTYFHRTKELMEHDLISDKVLLSKDFFYFGISAIPLDKFKINIPKTQSAHGVRTTDDKEVSRLWEYLTNHFRKNSVIGPPHYWKANEPFEHEQ